MNGDFGQKKCVKKIGPDVGPPGRPAGRPLNGGPDRSVGASDPSRTVGDPEKPHKSVYIQCKNVLSSQSYAQNTILARVGVSGAHLGRAWAEGLSRARKTPLHPKMLEHCRYERFDQIWPTRGPIYGVKNYVHICTYMHVHEPRWAPKRLKNVFWA